MLGRGKILVKKKHTPVCEIENSKFWYGRSKILVKKNILLYVCEIENPEFWYGHGKILVKRNYTPGVKKNFKVFFSNLFFKSPEFWYGHGKILVKKKHAPVREIENSSFGTFTVKLW